MSTNNLYRGLFELLTLPQGDAVAEMLLASGRVARRELLVVARQEDCLPELYARWAIESQLSPLESADHEHIVRRKAFAADVLRGLPVGTVLGGSGGTGSEGAAIEILLPDFAAIGPLHEAVGRLGYRLHGAGEWLVPLRDPMHRGLATFSYMGTAPGAVPIDVQVGGVPLDARRNIAFADFAPQTARLDGLPCRALEPTRQLLLRIAAFGARGIPVTLREIAELHLLLKDAARPIDHAWLQGKIERLDAWAGLRQLRDAIIAKRLGALLSWGEFGRLIEASATRGEAAVSGGTPAAGVGSFVRRAFELVPGPRENDLGARLARAPWLVSQVLGAGYRVRGVPVSSKVFDTPRFMRIDGALYLTTGAGLILLSLVDLGDMARAGVGERVRSGNRSVVLARWTAARPIRRSSARAR